MRQRTVIPEEETDYVAPVFVRGNTPERPHGFPAYSRGVKNKSPQWKVSRWHSHDERIARKGASLPATRNLRDCVRTGQAGDVSLNVNKM
jgi:hypothetical protein